MSEGNDDILARVLGRSRYLRDIGEVKSPDLLDQAAAEITILRRDEAIATQERDRLRDDLAAEREERDKLAKEVAHLRAAMSREDGPQYLANLLMEAEAALLNAAQQRDKAERERAAAQEREQRMREATIFAAVEEYILQHPNEGPDERLSRAATVRGMMVRLGLYAEFEQRLDYAVLHSPFRDALSAMRGEP